MPLHKLILVPDQSGYSVEDGQESLAVKLDGGLSRYRRDVIGAASVVKVQWTIGPDDYTYLRTFYRTAVGRGAQGFLIDLIMDEPTPTEHTAFFVPGSMKLSRVRGLTYTVQARLEVKPLAEDTEYDEGIIMIYEEYGTDADEMLNMFDTFANVDLPELLGA